MRAIAAICLLILGACTEQASSPRPLERGTPPSREAPMPSERSLELAAYYAKVEQSQRAKGLMRVDGGGVDTPFAKRQLVENFIQIAAFNEFTLIDGVFTNSPSEGRIKRWAKPVRLQMHFADTVDPGTRRKDRSLLAGFAARLARLSGLDIKLAQSGNFHVAVLDVDALEAFGPSLDGLFPGIAGTTKDTITQMPRSQYCAVYTFEDADQPDELHSAIAIIRAEHPDLLRQSCFHEEIAQGLGLSNDSPRARPSIFNDDDEFALLTRHDELLVQMLYDDSVPLGATPNQLRPIATASAEELLGGDS